MFKISESFSSFFRQFFETLIDTDIFKFAEGLNFKFFASV